MQSLRSSRVFVSSLAGAVLLGAVLTGCTNGDEGTGPSPSASVPSSAPEVTPTPEPTTAAPSILQFPEVTDKEIARATLVRTDDGVTSPNTVSDAIVSGEPLILEGACVGEAARYQVRSAAADDPNGGDDADDTGDDAADDATPEPGEDADPGDAAGAGEVLASGRLACDTALYEELSFDIDGPVQVSFSDSDDIDEGWLLLTRVGDAE